MHVLDRAADIELPGDRATTDWMWRRRRWTLAAVLLFSPLAVVTLLPVRARFPNTRERRLIDPVRDRALHRAAASAGEQWATAVLVVSLAAIALEVLLEDSIRRLREDDLSLMGIAPLEPSPGLRTIQKRQRPRFRVVVVGKPRCKGIAVSGAERLQELVNSNVK
ncbi:hypothetical protein [Natrinema salinisoli]|uniref:hypothetical protein n=1 Tax=Natrinema salinisoli TaxID=2878535 RepID=UPI001CF06686|nr:hypothetical protein [Natrinema salinisoli]